MRQALLNTIHLDVSAVQVGLLCYIAQTLS